MRQACSDVKAKAFKSAILLTAFVFGLLPSAPAAQDNGSAVTVPTAPAAASVETGEQGQALNQSAKSAGPQILTDINQSTWLKSIEMEKGHLSLVAGRSHLMRLQRNIARISVSNPDIVDAVILSPNEILLNAKDEGSVNIILWDHMNRVTVFDITVTQDPDILYEVLNKIAPETKFEVFPSNEVFVVKGDVDSVAKQKEVEKAANAFAEGSVSLVRVTGAKQVLLKIRFVQLNHSQDYDFGVDMQYLGRNIGPLIRPGGTGATLDQDVDFTPRNSAVSYHTLSTVPSTAGVHWIPYFTRDQGINTFVKSLESKGIGKIIARPNLLASDGQEASFLVGGEAAVVAISSTNVGVDYREFGTRLTFTPEILPNGKIRLTVAPEVSALDFANGVNVNNVTIPSFTTIRTNTVVELRNRETLLIGGLLQQKINVADAGVPFLRRVPLIGKLFDNTSHSYEDTELLVIVTPVLVDPSQQIPEDDLADGDALTLASKFEPNKVKDEQQEAVQEFLLNNQRNIRDTMARYETPAAEREPAPRITMAEPRPVAPAPRLPVKETQKPAVQIANTPAVQNLDQMQAELDWDPAPLTKRAARTTAAQTVKPPAG
ncbi:MAG TPA: pilus assembly protein N-terminal domain-containing protein [Verrucomicrobiae bacterium]|jgi:pilus assembly protein CpaC|nr:pilus assembly protein N-terminal domain-containing protein [Verrucomicrobiae bacterium]